MSLTINRHQVNALGFAVIFFRASRLIPRRAQNSPAQIEILLPIFRRRRRDENGRGHAVIWREERALQGKIRPPPAYLNNIRQYMSYKVAWCCGHLSTVIR